MKDKIRTLEEICDKEDFSINLHGNTYCSLAMSKKIECDYQSKNKDKNGIYVCYNLKFNKNDYIEV